MIMAVTIEGVWAVKNTHQHDSPVLAANAGRRSWPKPIWHYMFFLAIASLVWEFAHMPLYTLWETGTVAEVVFAAIHCTGGDILIAFFALISALVIGGNSHWPLARRTPVIVLTVLLGLAYTFFSEWLNIQVRGTWAYRDLMPIIPVIEMGLSPFLQWVIVPLAAFRWALSDRYATGMM